MLIIRLIMFGGLAVALGAVPSAQTVASESQAIVDFQRAVDTYAFQHRQVERRAGEAPGEAASGMRSVRVSSQDGDIFSPLVAAAFHTRINAALRSGSCRITETGANAFLVPRPNEAATGTAPLPACLAAVLPRLPEELEYRVAGVVMVLVDRHANLVIDVLHGAFPPPDTP